MAEVLCNYCQRSGEVEVLSIKGKNVEYRDGIDHTEDCPIRKKLDKAAQPRHLRKKKWRMQEKRGAQVLGIRETAASGALNEDGDAREFHGVRLECKQTSSETFCLNAFIWSKLIKGARRVDEVPVLQVELHRGGRQTRFYVFPKGAYDVISKEIKQRYVRRGLHLRADLVAQTPFHVTTLDPIPVVVTESQLLECMRETE